MTSKTIVIVGETHITLDTEIIIPERDIEAHYKEVTRARKIYQPLAVDSGDLYESPINDNWHIVTRMTIAS